MTARDYLWVEKYRPQTIEECILPKSIKDSFLKMVQDGNMPNLLLAGTPGCGKTTAARALCRELEYDVLFINASKERNIDTIRNTITAFASSMSIEGTKKAIILDEADYMNAESAQPALRGVMEEFHKNTRFILTCNHKNRIIAPLHSRTTVVDFRTTKAEKPAMLAGMFKRLKVILEAEGVEVDDDVLAKVIMRHFPDSRRTINDLQRYSAGGVIDSGILTTLSEESMKVLTKALAEKDFGTMRKWVGENCDNDASSIYRSIYENVYDLVTPDSIPQMILLIHDYKYKGAFVADPEINLTAFFTECMGSLEFK
jgi:DNA polymerase III delta prime subunit